MSHLLIGFVVGLGSVGLTIVVLRRLSPRVERRAYAALLLGAALVYVAFALAGGGVHWTAVELGGVVLYGALAILGARVSPWFLVAGWLAHPVWDVALHAWGAAPFVPSWYPIACIAYDLAVAAYLAFRARGFRAERCASAAAVGG